jgi:bacterioferritin-associated ferredoxin
MNSNPLSQYFRQPAIYVRLPSQGRFYPPGAIDLPANGELPVLPMTTLDEITYRTPDALFNGQAVATVIQSCVPNIKDAWAVPAMDIDTILIAIRIATYGHQLDVDTVCPSCESENTFGVDLRHVLDKIRAPDYTQTVKNGDLEIYFRPMTYGNINENSLAQFEEQKSLQIIDENTEQTAEARSKQLSEILKQITTVTVKALAQSISAVKTPQATVTEAQHIEEWLSNCDRKLFGAIRDHIIKIKQSGEIAPLDCQCGSCQHQYQQPLTLNMSDFFEAAS